VPVLVMVWELELVQEPVRVLEPALVQELARERVLHKQLPNLSLQPVLA
jgi:hypothetical protein